MSERTVSLSSLEAEALARRLLSRLAMDWHRYLSWEDVPHLSESAWSELVDALDRQTVLLIRRAGEADQRNGVDSIWLYERAAG